MSEVSAVRMGMEDGGGFGAAAHLSVWANFDGFRPAKAMDLSGGSVEEFESFSDYVLAGET